ncbi:MAG: ATP-dependent Clp protease adaptor ClpS [Phycisphaerales bacterium]
MAPQTQTRPTTETDTEQPWLWNVVLLNDDDHGFDYVIEMLRALFGHPEEKGFRIADRVNTDGRAVCLTTHKEHAELKRDQVHAFGPDRRIAGCKGAMSAIIEPAELDEDAD